MTTEDRPHVVYEQATGWGYVCSSYAEAHERWGHVHSAAKPYLIATLGRVIDPATPIIDVNE
jgi:hypothetical protein